MGTITVKGKGKVTAIPDLIIVSISLYATDIKYEKTMQIAADQLEEIRTTLLNAGFSKEDIKTTGFDVSTKYNRVLDKNSTYCNVFAGYSCQHNLKIEFDKDMLRLSKVLDGIAKCTAEPEFTIHFSVKDKEKISAELLESAVSNAKEKALVLTRAAGVVLGDIVDISYDWSDLHLHSTTGYEIEKGCAAESLSIDIEPDDINVSDTVSIVWKIE